MELASAISTWGDGIHHVYDVNGDGRNDIVTSMAHDYGIFWLEQTAAGKWTKHLIDDSWSQAHAMTMVDLNGDGQMDFVTGKRFMAHNGHDPGEREPLGVYWYESSALDGGKNDGMGEARGGLQFAYGRRCRFRWRIWMATAS